MTGCPQCAQLRQQIVALRREYGQEFQHGDMNAVREKLGLTRDQSRIVLTLFYADDFVSSHALEKRIDSTFDCLKTHICRIRSVAGRDLIETRYGIGYRLGMGGRLRVLEEMEAVR